MKEWIAPRWVTPDHSNDAFAKKCLEHLPPKVAQYISSYQMKDFGFFAVTFRNGHDVVFRKQWKEFVAECILVYDLPPADHG